VCLLKAQIWPLIDAMAVHGVYYVDLHAGNVMVDEQLENAWLIDFECAIDESRKPGEPVDEVGLRAAIEDQKSALLTIFTNNR
jgi:predicted unusual protein kinase regulating ubiquinone biosynthesis (AarF/ABC1/UbiB family)